MVYGCPIAADDETAQYNEDTYVTFVLDADC